MSKTYRVAFIGCGRRAHEHAVGVKADARCEVVALSDINAEAAAALNTEFGFEGVVYTDYKEMLANERPDVVILCLWTPLHLPVFRDCAEAGVKALLSEKPMAPTWGDCQELARIAERTGCQLTFSHQRRFSSGNRAVRKMIGDGVFGKLLRMDLFSPPNLLDCGTHTFDQALSFMNECPAKWVLGAVDASETYNWFNVPSESVAAGIIVFENGVRANIQLGGPDMDIWGGVRVIGEKGFIEVFWDGEFRQAAVYADPSWKPPVIELQPGEQMIGLVRNALDCLETGEEPELSYKKALRAAEIIFAFYESVRRHARVALPLEGVTDNPFITMLENGAFAHSAAYKIKEVQSK
ncbi:Gfo/Idh/MocA family protein [Paenibacillus humicola]|uniref:Gfo/Idh/MocA family protein n=1 Tax=Paenibacillus humicola TaxID=3110540 RepID=UPI00237A3F58|nr:Gfo/Idh/MocA family oxidoreductase [Paenibacillus humicola]